MRKSPTQGCTPRVGRNLNFYHEEYKSLEGRCNPEEDDPSGVSSRGSECSTPIPLLALKKQALLGNPRYITN